MQQPLVIGVAGGSGSGKTTVIQHILKQIGSKNLALIAHDSYYRDLKHLPFDERAQQNFDHPSALETELLIRHLKALCSGYSIECPIYDFANHVRKDTFVQITPKKVILIDGILIFCEKELRHLMDIKLFVDTDDDVRLLRRLRRDICERERSVESVLEQYEKHVRPMHLEFVEPTKRYADIIIPHGGENRIALEMLNALIDSRIRS
ncbi:uridine kinase [Balneolaceae bacterium ANBcel3]|nr:uridine kinase [Balneolaceae bacterium ANBcel3]